MLATIFHSFRLLFLIFSGHRTIVLENLALRQQLAIYKRVNKRPHLAHSPWQNGFVERLIVSIRRECLDHVIVLNEASLRKILRSYFRYYERSRTHLALGKDAPEPRA